MDKEEYSSDFELFSKYFLYDEVLDLVFNRVSRARASAFNVSGFINELDKRVITFRGKSYQSHRIAYLLQYGKWPDRYLYDSEEPYLNNNTGCRNISFHRLRQKYILCLTDRDGKSRYCGSFLTVKAAAAAKERLLQTEEFKRV